MFETFFQNSTKQALTTYDQIVNQINALEKDFNTLTDIQLQDYTSQLKVDLRKGTKSEDQIIIESFALVREATIRVLGLRHFDVQLIGGLILHEGKIAEMKTGEGKTLVALLPTFLNALSGQGVHVVTVNDYLARRDAEYVGQVHRFLGLSVGLIQENMEFSERQANYSCDVIYVTNNELGFDYLRDNMAFTLDEIVQRPFFYCVVDEVDAILIDEARTPLIISGPSKAPTQKYFRTTKLADTLRKDIHYSVDEKNQNATLLEEGLAFCEQALGISDLYNVEDPWIPYILNSIKAKELFVRNTHYIVNEENEIIIVDEFTGRTMIGRRWSDGLHQAVEAKEGLPIQVAVMGCVVNGPGEARSADLGIAAGKKRGHLFIKGQVVKVVDEQDMVDALLKEGRLIAEEGIEARLAAADTNAAQIAEEDVQALLNIQGDINNFEEKTKSVIEITTNKDIQN